MTTLQQERPAVAGTPSTRRSGLMIGMIVIGLLIGLLGGWLIFGSDDVVNVDGTGLTDRQTEMLELIDADFAAWQDNDVDLVLSHYTDTAAFVARGVEYRVADGGLADYVASFLLASSMEQIGPNVVVDGNTVMSFHTFGGSILTNVFEFTSSGEVLIARHEVSS
ncbi:MAG: hypothetical protein OEQ47_01475 [Acidimicrobiia bacterium]|nr:hypothetical protein [Acidimicrobiia bacterium]